MHALVLTDCYNSNNFNSGHFLSKSQIVQAFCIMKTTQAVITFYIWKTSRLFNSWKVSNFFDFMRTTLDIFCHIILNFFFIFLWSLNIDGHLSRLFSSRYSDSQFEGKTGSPILKRLQTGCEGQKLSSSAYLVYESYHIIFASVKNFSIWRRQSHDTYAAYDMHVVSHNFWSFFVQFTNITTSQRTSPISLFNLYRESERFSYQNSFELIWIH